MSSLSALDRLRRWITGVPATSAPSSSMAANGKPSPHAGGLRLQRSGRREQLFALVRENMIRMGVLSSHYKFKVLTLDPAGEQFIVMVDWQPGALGAGPAFEQPFEAGLQQLLVERQQGFKVKAVYWRGHAEASTLGGTSGATSGGVLGNVSSGAPASAPHARAARAAPGIPAPASAARARALAPQSEHVSEDELQALQTALRQAGASPQAAPTPARRARAAEFPDFEPTVNTEGQHGTEFGALSETQYGKLS